MSALTSSIRGYLKIPWLKFVLRMLLIYGVWKFFHQGIRLWIPGIESWWTRWTDTYAIVVADVSKAIMRAGTVTLDETYPAGIVVAGSPGLLVEDHCLAIPATIIFAAFIAFYPGPWKTKFWFIPLGIIAVQFINVLRLIGLSWLQYHYSPAFFRFHHSYTALIMWYGMVFILVAWWMNRYSTYNLHRS